MTAQHIERTGRGAAPEPGPAAGQQARPPRQLAGLGPHLGHTALLLAALASAPVALTASPDTTQPSAPRRAELVRMVRQDCGSCHGMRLTGGLGPALTREALADKSLEGLAITIYQGRLGTPMPGWRSMLSEPEAQWIAERLQAGFPQEDTR